MLSLKLGLKPIDLLSLELHFLPSFHELLTKLLRGQFIDFIRARCPTLAATSRLIGGDFLLKVFVHQLKLSFKDSHLVLEVSNQLLLFPQSLRVGSRQFPLQVFNLSR